eukprot:5413141-Pyramimonas_sp.AAC.1
MVPLPSQAQAPPHAAPDTSEAVQQRDQSLAAVSLAELNSVAILACGQAPSLSQHSKTLAIAAMH